MRRQEINSKFLKAQGKVAQEFAIARRINTAEEVKIEEFYNTSGSGEVGVSANEDGAFVGAQGSGEKVTKRVYTFKGYREGGLEVFEDFLEKQNENE